MTQPDELARVQVAFRVPEGLKDRLTASAKRRGLSDNAAGILALEAWCAAEENRADPPRHGARPKLKGPTT